jgi:hypothetical protein
MTETEQNVLESYLDLLEAGKQFNNSLMQLNDDNYDSTVLMNLAKLGGYLDVVITALDKIGDLIKEIIPPAKS